MGWDGFGKTLIVVGAVIAGIGLLFLLAIRAGFGDAFGWIGRLPGDIFIKRDNFTFYFPVATSIIVSIVLTLLLLLVSLFTKH
jgi:hypothetical protein